MYGMSDSNETTPRETKEGTMLDRMHARMIADELKGAGFYAVAASASEVAVRLNRRGDIMEVDLALQHIGFVFDCRPASDGSVIVTIEGPGV
jgi:hypothetical protein